MIKKPKYNIAIMGATGAVGVEMLQILEQRKFPVDSLKLLASKRSAGQKMKFRGRALTIEELNEKSFQDMDIVLQARAVPFLASTRHLP